MHWLLLLVHAVRSALPLHGPLLDVPAQILGRDARRVVSRNEQLIESGLLGQPGGPPCGWRRRSFSRGVGPLKSRPERVLAGDLERTTGAELHDVHPAEACPHGSGEGLRGPK